MNIRTLISYLNKNPRLAAGLGVFFLLVLFNLTRRPLESEATRSYETWLRNINEIAKVAESDPAVIPEITITLKSRSDDVGVNWQFATSRDPALKDNNDRVLRLLDLIRASRILEASRKPTAELYLVVREKEKTFEAYFERSDAAQNVSLGNFLKLFQIYVTTVPGSAEKVSGIN